MIEAIVKAFDGLLSDFNWRRVASLILFTAYVAIIFGICEAFSAHFRLSRLERTAGIIEKLQDIDSHGFKPDSALSKTYSDLEHQLQELTNPAPTSLPSLLWLWKSLAAATPWLLSSSVLAFDKRSALYGVLALGVITGIIGAFVPTFMWPWGNLIIFPIAAFILTAAIIVRVQNQINMASLKE